MKIKSTYVFLILLIVKKIRKYSGFIIIPAIYFLWTGVVHKTNDDKHRVSDLDVIMQERAVSLKEKCRQMRNHGNIRSIFNFEIQELFVVDQYRFCKVPKCGCTFWLQTFLIMKQIIKPEDLYTLDREDLHWRLQESVIAYNYIPQQSDILIMVTRDPWQRLYSAYMDKIYRGQSNFVNLYKEIASNNNSCDESPSFQQFLDYIVRTNANSGVHDAHWRPISSVCNVCSSKYTYILKQEYFTKESLYLLDVLIPQPSEGKDNLKSLLTDTGNSLHQLVRQFVSEMPTCKNGNFLNKLKRLWISFQSQGLISDDNEFEPGHFQHLSETNVNDIVNMVVSKGLLINMTKEERKRQRHHHMIRTYKSVKLSTLRMIQSVYMNDFLLFGYSKSPPS